MTSSKAECTLMCLSTNGCLVASVTTTGHAVSCHLSTSASEENTFADDVGSDILVVGKSIQR